MMDDACITPDDVCKHCAKNGCYEHCQKTDHGNHIPDPCSISHDPDTGGGRSLIFDISCVECGLSGSFNVSPEDINWA